MWWCSPDLPLAGLVLPLCCCSAVQAAHVLEAIVEGALPTLVLEAREQLEFFGTAGASRAASNGDGASTSSAAGQPREGSDGRRELEEATNELEDLVSQLPQQWDVPQLQQELAQRLAPAGARLAAAMLRFEAKQAQQGALLELAQACATRSCAYLRCCQLSTGGGAFKGQGAGSKKCSGCRAVCYCGTACATPDWRAGHKRVCKALAAVRQEARQQARQDH